MLVWISRKIRIAMKKFKNSGVCGAKNSKIVEFVMQKTRK